LFRHGSIGDGMVMFLTGRDIACIAGEIGAQCFRLPFA
jgi:hypothetical protein